LKQSRFFSSEKARFRKKTSRLETVTFLRERSVLGEYTRRRDPTPGRMAGHRRRSHANRQHNRSKCISFARLVMWIQSKGISNAADAASGSAAGKPDFSSRKSHVMFSKQNDPFLEKTGFLENHNFEEKPFVFQKK
jgi:hypothetical protein